MKPSRLGETTKDQGRSPAEFHEGLSALRDRCGPEREADVFRERPATLIAALRSWAARSPHRVVYTFLTEGEEEGGRLTFGELDAEARAIAAELRRADLAGERVLLVYSPGLEFITAFFGCLYAGAIAVPVYPPSSRRNVPRVAAIARDARPAAVLTSGEARSRSRALLGGVPELATARWLVTDQRERDADEPFRDPGAEALAFLQYTSGSTSTPKGVMVSHGNLLNNQEAIRQAFDQTEDSVVVGWLPLFHDMGLIGNVLQPLYVGARCVLMSPMAFLARPVRWLRAISRYRGTTSGGPNFAYDLCARRIGPEEREGLALDSWRVAFNGAEPVRGETLARFAEAFAPYGFRAEAFFPCYGLAEATLFVAGGRVGEGATVVSVEAEALRRGRAVATDPQQSSLRLVASGRAAAGLAVAVADPETGDRCPDGHIGEIRVSGPSVAQGYWGRPEVTEREFRARLRDEEPAGPFLRTGDLGFLRDGRLYVTGRLKDLIIIRGRNHYPQDLEMTVEESHPALRAGGCAAFSVEAGGEERLVVACELARHAESEAEAAITAARQAVSEMHEVAVHEVVLLRTGTLPKTSSGKVQRHACRAGYLAGTLAVVGRSAVPATAATAEDGDEGVGLARDELLALAPGERRSALAGLLRRLAARAARLPAAHLDAGVPLTAAGLDSLGAVELRQALATRLGVAVSLADLLAGVTVDELAERVLSALEEAPAAGGPLVAGDAVEGPLSYGQRALWFLHRLAPESAAYNIAVAARVRSRLDVEALRRACEAAVERHPALRTSFPVRDGEPRQRVGDHPVIGFSLTSAAGWSEDELQARIAAEAWRPFDLATGPLLRAAVFALVDGGSAVVLTVHHAVADFASMAILARELGVFYAAGTGGPPPLLAAPEVSYLDYARWQHERLAGEEGERLWTWWRDRLRGAPLVLDLPADRPRPLVQTYAGGTVSLRLDPGLTAAAGALSRARGATLYTVLLSIFQALLHRHTGQEDLLVGSPAAGRTRPELQEVVGYFVNPVVVRADLSGLPSFTALLERTRRNVLGALDHQDFPLPLLVERLQPERDPSRSPLFQAMFVLQQGRDAGEAALGAFALGEPGARLELGGLELEPMALGGGYSQVDLTLSAAGLDDGLTLALRYNVDLFDAGTARRALGHLATLLTGAVAEPERAVAELPLLTAAEQCQLLEWNDTGTAHGDRCLHELFEVQAERVPEAVALVHGDLSLTYRTLEERANRLAAHLLAMGVVPETRVGVLLERTLDLPVTLLSILKAGAAYVPLDPAYPPERLAFMLDDSGASLVVTRRGLESRAAPSGGARRALCLDVEAGEIAARSSRRPPAAACPENLAYLIYTSGSTGRPKAVAIEHRRAAALVRWAGEAFPPEDLAGVLFSTSVCFDLSIFELFAPLAHGGRVILAANALELPALAAAPAVRLVNTVPSALAELLSAGALPPGVRTVCLAGEPLQRALARRIYATGTVESVWNLYGPSEDTTYSTGVRVPAAGSAEPSIGGPLTGRRAHVLDRCLLPAPEGVPGELYLGGAGLARGYLGRPELTAERFVPIPAGEPGERLYRTGDLARRRPDGELEFLGRIDHQVKIRGFRIELGEIESALARQGGMRETVVLAREDAPGDRRLVAYVVPAAVPAAGWAAELRAGLRKRLPEVMVPAAFVVLPALPRTPNGKVDRRALPAPEREASPVSMASPGRPLVELVASVWAGVLGVERLGPDESFFDRGGHSLLAARAVARLNAALGVDLRLSAVFEAPTAARLAERIESSLVVRALPPLAPIPRPDGEAPTSFAQERLWFLDRLAPGSPVYNMAAALRLGGDLDAGALERALRGVLERQESLRTTFRAAGGRPRQVVAPSSDLDLPRVDLSGLASTIREPERQRLLAVSAQQPFDLTAGPLLRGLLVRTAPAEHWLLLVCHHAVADGWSLRGVVAPELAALYTAFAARHPAALPAPTVQYADWADWQRRCLDEEQLRRETEHWQRRLAGARPLELPTDRPRPSTPGQRGGVRTLPLAAELSRAVNGLARFAGATRFMVFLAAFQAFLGRLAGQDDVTVGTVVDQRDRQELEGVAGLFVNTLPLRADLADRPPLRKLVARTRAACLEAWAHRDLPFERLVEALRPGLAGGGSVFDVAFTLQEDPPLPVIPGLDLAVAEVHTGTAKFDLTLQVTGASDLTLEYAADRIDAVTAARWLEGYQVFLAAALARPDESLSTLPLLGEAVRHQVLVEWNDTARQAPGSRPVHELVAARAAAAPEALAVVGERESLTYGGLERRANAVARRLLALGVAPGEPVGVLAGRSPAMIAALLGVLKAGAAYLPLDPAEPAERLAFVTRDARAPVVLAERGLEESAAACGVTAVLLDGAESADAPAVAVPLESLAYVVYTSGSTGQPKGVQVPHAGLLNLIGWHLGAYGLGPADRVTQLAGLGFDASVWEIWPCLAAGASLLLVPEEVRLSSPRLREWLAREGIALSFLPTPLAEAALAGPWPAAPALRALLTGGDRLHRRPPSGTGFRLVNHYGPTEASVVATAADVAPSGAGAPLIGRPVDNLRAYLVDAGLLPVPPGVPGELCLAGASLARGYLGRPDLTAERFVPDPFATEPGGRLYRTGDRARHRPGGSLDFLGRGDEQVKVRGVRIEPGEIEAALARHPAVRASAVALREDAPGGPRLVAYVVAAEGGPEVAGDELGRFLRGLLPEVMVPVAFVPLVSLPLTAHGKVDRRALPQPGALSTASEADWVAPRTPLEEVLAGMWGEVLGVERVGVHDDFFALGGHSLLATELVAAVRETFDLDVPLRSFFAARTVAGLAAELLADAGTRERLETAAEVLLELSRLSDLEIEAALTGPALDQTGGKA